jgi:uncharacterized repeat protein (TIGR01451 family)
MKNKKFTSNLIIIFMITIFLLTNISSIQPEIVKAGSNDGYDLTMAILANQSTYVSSSYWDRDQSGCRQRIVLSSMGEMQPTNGSTFALLSTGIAGANPATTDTENPGNERGTWFKNRYSKPFDQAVLTMVLKVPSFMHYLYYDFQFFSTEFPEYVGSQYNDKFEVTVNSPSKGISKYVCDVNSGNFVLNSNDIPGTGFDLFAQSGRPSDVDIVDTTPRNPGADAGATALVTRGGESHSVSPNEQITVTFSIKDIGDNQFDSAAFIDNLVFLGYARTEIIARKSVEDLNGGLCEPNDILQYSITISNTGNVNQANNAGNEFEDIIPKNTTYVASSATATSGIIAYDNINKMITWNGDIASESSLVIKFKVTVNSSCKNNAIVSNQGTVLWDSNENGTNGAIEYTDDSSIDDGVDLDGDGETNDDDPTKITVISFEPPSNVTEDFSDDTPGGSATQLYLLREWFNTTNSDSKSSFEVASAYHYDTARSFKTKIRSTTESLYWNYNLSNLEADLKCWEVWFTCGNASEDADLFLTFKNNAEQEIAKIKFEYVQKGSDYLTDWLVEMYYYNPSTGWDKFNSGIYGDYLHNGWYKLKIERKDSNNINYYLYNSTNTLVDFKTAPKLDASFSNLKQIIWSSTKNPVVCPMFFWDEHKLELI